MSNIFGNEMPVRFCHNQGRDYRRSSQCNAPGLRIAVFYCKIFLLKAQVNLLLLNVTPHQ